MTTAQTKNFFADNYYWILPLIGGIGAVVTIYISVIVNGTELKSTVVVHEDVLKKHGTRLEATREIVDRDTIITQLNSQTLLIHGNLIAKESVRLDDHDERLHALGSIQTDVHWIKEAVKDIKADLKGK